MEVIYSDDIVDVSIEICPEITTGVFIHTNVKSFSVSKYKRMLVIWANICSKLKEDGWEYVYALPPGKKEEKWETLFGLEFAGLLINKHKLMRRKL
jgi:hypothetical protein